jgi:pimeloyl-ACP methyl ester carboxylesterase
MSYPADLHLIDRPAADPADPANPAVILVHGSLDRAESFRRVMRRLPDVTVVAYDRRGYQGSRDGGVTGLDGHVADLLAVGRELRARGAGLLSAVGHSLGGDVVVGAGLAEPGAFDSIGAFEPPMPWLGFRRTPPGSGQPRAWTPLAEDPGAEAEEFFGRMVSPSAWKRLSDEGRATRRADGPALVADMMFMRGPEPFDVMALTTPVVFGMGGEGSQPHHRRAVTWLGSHVPGGETFEIEGAQHGAHLSHPDHFATFVRRVLERGSASAEEA